MGHPARKESLGRGMTGGHGAAPYFTEFMNYFMKDKPRESFFKTPKMPEDMKAIIEQRKREFAEAEALARANGEGGGSRGGGGGAVYSRRRSGDDSGPDTEDNSVPSLDTIILPPPEPRGNAGGNSGDRDAPPAPKPGADRDAPPATGPKPKPPETAPPSGPPKPAANPAGTTPPPGGATRPREAEPKKPEPKKQGKKGNDEPGR
jgi:membrane peptidoglycan carboxypeptidase